MQHQHGELSPQIYHRIYRLHQRHHDPLLIAAALNLSAKMVQHVIDRFAASAEHSAAMDERDAGIPSVAAVADDLPVVAVFPRTQYAILDVSGKLTVKNLGLLKEELKNAQEVGLDYKAIAVRFVNVNSLDEQSINEVLAFLGSLEGKTRYTAILDPSPAADALLTRLNIEARIPIFGTERSFEENAFRKGNTDTRKMKKV